MGNRLLLILILVLASKLILKAQVFEITNTKIEDFYVGTYDNQVSGGQEPFYIDTKRFQKTTSLNNGELLIINGRYSNQNPGFSIVNLDSAGIPINANYFSNNNDEIVVNDVLQLDSSILFTGVINELQSFIAKFDNSFNPIWIKRISIDGSQLYALNIFTTKNRFYFTGFESQQFTDSQTSDTREGSFYIEFNPVNGSLINKLYFEDGDKINGSPRPWPGSDIEKLLIHRRLTPNFTQTYKNSIYHTTRASDFQGGLGNDSLKIVKLDIDLNIIWSKYIQSNTSLTAYNHQNYLHFDSTTNQFEISVSNSLNENIREIIYKLDTNGNILDASSIYYSMPLTFMDRPVNQKFFKRKEFDLFNGNSIEYFSTHFWEYNDNSGNFFRIADQNNSTISTLHLSFQSSRNSYYAKEFVDFNYSNGKLKSNAIVRSNFTDINKYELSIDHHSFSFNGQLNWDCEDDSWQLLPSIQQFTNYTTGIGQIDIENYNDSIFSLSLTRQPLSTETTVKCSVFDTCVSMAVNIIPGNYEVCQGESLVLASSIFLVDSLQWTINGQVISTQNRIDFLFDSVGNFLVELTGYNVHNSCTAYDSILIKVLTVPRGFVEDTLVCKNDTVFVSLDSTNSYLWLTKNLISCDTCSSNLIIVTDSSSFRIRATNNFGCSSIDTLNLNVYPLPSANISGTNTVCPGSQNVWYGVTPEDSFSVNWWIDSIGIITQAFNDSIYVNWPSGIPSATIFAYLEYPAGCAGDTISFSVKVNEALEPKILAPNDSICFVNKDNQEYTLSYNTNGSIYLWDIENGDLISGDSTNHIIVNWDTVGTGILKVREYSVTNIDSCFGMDSIEIVILPNPNISLNISGQTQICLNEEYIYSADSGWINSNYIWNAEGIFTDSIFNSTSIKLQWDSVGIYEVNITEVSEYGCNGVTDSLLVNVNPIPNPIRVGNDTLLCLNEGVASEIILKKYSVSGLNESTYNWEVEGGSIVSGQGSDMIDIAWDSSLIKILKVQEISEFGCESETLLLKDYLDFSRLELFLVSTKSDSGVFLDFELENLRTYPGDSIWISRREESDSFSNWSRIAKVGKRITDFLDTTADYMASSYGYRIEGINSCSQDILSRDHASVFLSASTINENSEGLNSEINLDWTEYRNWKNGIEGYEIYEIIDEQNIKIGESNSNTYNYLPSVPRLEHCFRIKAIENTEFPEISWSNVHCIEIARPIQIPNVLTVNNDGKNDYLKLPNLEAWETHKIKIFNRWGILIFESNDYESNWPSSNISSGTYFYNIEISNTDNRINKSFSGWIQIFK